MPQHIATLSGLQMHDIIRHPSTAVAKAIADMCAQACSNIAVGMLAYNMGAGNEELVHWRNAWVERRRPQ